MTPYDFVRVLLEEAHATIGVRESSHNGGPEISAWLRYAGAQPGDPWCIAWVVAMHAKAANRFGIDNPCPLTAGSLHLYAIAPHECRVVDLPVPGDVFILDTGAPGGAGHGGIVGAVSPSGEKLWTIEGNSNAAGSREGDSVAQHTWSPRTGARGRLVGYLRFANLVKETPLVLPDGLPPSPFTS